MGTADRPVVVSIASREDAGRLTEIELRAFEADTSSVLWLLLNPPAQRHALPERVQKRIHTLEEAISVPQSTVVKGTVDGHIVGYAKWVRPGEDDTSGALACDEASPFRERFQACIKKTRRRVLGQSHYWYLSMLAVDPTAWKTGVGRSLVQWGIDQAQQESTGSHICFLEASVMGEAFYHKLGFETVGWDSINDRDAPDGVCSWPYMILRG